MRPRYLAARFDMQSNPNRARITSDFSVVIWPFHGVWYFFCARYQILKNRLYAFGISVNYVRLCVRIVGKPSFSDQFKKIIKRYKRVDYNMHIMRQSACLVVNPITVYGYGFFFNCTTVGRASDSMTALT